MFFAAFKAFIIVYAFGLSLTRFLLGRLRVGRLLEWSLAYGLGLGLFSYWMFAVGVLRIPYSFSVLAFPVLTLTVFIFFFSWRKPAGAVPAVPPEKDKNGCRDILCLLGVLYICWNLAYVFNLALNTPVKSWDELATVAFKAKVVFFDHSLRYLKNLPHTAYPLHVPLSEAWVALCAGQWNDYVIKLFFPLAYVSFLGIHFSFLKELTNTRWAVLGVVLLISSNLFTLHATISYRDFFVAYYNCTAVYVLLLWRRRNDVPLLILSSVFAALAAWTKIEGTIYLFIVLFVLLAIVAEKKAGFRPVRLRPLMRFVPVPLFLVGGHHLYRILLAIEIEKKSRLVFQGPVLERFLDFWEKFALDIFGSANWNIVWILLLVSLPNIRAWRSCKEIRFLFLALCLFIGNLAFLSTFTESYVYIGGHQWITGLPRLILHFYPLAPALIVLLNAPLKPLASAQGSRS